MSELLYVSTILDGLRFTGMDQNPKGIRDTLYSGALRAENLHTAAWEVTHGEGDLDEALAALKSAVEDTRYVVGKGG